MLFWMVITIALLWFVKHEYERRKREKAHKDTWRFGEKTEWKPAPWMTDQKSKTIELSKLDAAFDVMLGSKKTSKEKRSQYQSKFKLLNGSEQILHSRLREAAPALLIFAQVSMSQLFYIGNFRKDGYRQIGEIGRKSVDFLICREDTSIMLAIELNGPTHMSEKQKASDAKKRQALEEAGIPLIIITPDAIPDVIELRKILAPHILERKKFEADRNTRIQK